MNGIKSWYMKLATCFLSVSAQEVAGNHAVALWGRTEAGYATDPIMVERHLIFAVTRMQIRIENYPKW
jgi:fatty acyl-ACP thioesterase A